MYKRASILFKICLFQFLIPSLLLGQDITIETIGLLPLEIDQTSGIVLLNNNIITHNDKAGEPELFELDPDNGNLIGKVRVENALNTDWEDICLDQQYIYIGDFGNNQGDRTDLKIYRVSIQEYLQNSNEIVTPDTINFSYSDQVNFDPGNQHNYDAEAIISFKDSLYIFTKNRVDFQSNIYAIPKNPGTYQVSRTGTINTMGLVGGGVYNSLSGDIVLVGYTGTGPFLVRLYEFEESDFAGGTLDRIEFTLPGSFQTEGIGAINQSDYYISSETNVLGEASLYRINTGFVVGVDDFVPPELQLYPNPVHKILRIDFKENIESLRIQLTDVTGKQVYLESQLEASTYGTLELDLSQISDGNYLISLKTPGWQATRKLIIGGF